jgi:hypothetical protein
MQEKPLTPMSVCNEPSSLDLARKEVAALRLDVARLMKMNQVKTDTRVLDLECRTLNYKKFLQQKGLLEEFKVHFNY